MSRRATFRLFIIMTTYAGITSHIIIWYHFLEVQVNGYITRMTRTTVIKLWTLAIHHVSMVVLRPHLNNCGSRAGKSSHFTGLARHNGYAFYIIFICYIISFILWEIFIECYVVWCHPNGMMQRQTAAVSQQHRLWVAFLQEALKAPLTRRSAVGTHWPAECVDQYQNNGWKGTRINLSSS